MSTYRSDDLADILVGGGSRLRGESGLEWAGKAQGLILKWDPQTFSNTVRVRGSDLHDLPVSSGVEALTYQPGDVVILDKWKPSGRRGTATYYVSGRVVTPGSGRAEETVSWMRGSLARSISAQIFADRVHSDSIATTESTTSTTFTDLATVGPTVSDVDVTASGKALVFLSSEMTSPSSPNMSVEVSGATSIAASDERVLAFGTIDQFGGTMTRMIPLTGLNEGAHEFQAKYSDPNGEESFWAYRNLAVIAL